MTKAIYAGSFDPITNGHVDIINRAKGIFDFVYVAVSHNLNKTAFFTIDERISLINGIFKDDPKVECNGLEGLLVDYAQKKGVSILIRGLRAVSDFDVEFQMSLTNRELAPKIDTVFLMTDSKYSYLSSSLVKELVHLKADIEDFVPSHVKDALKEKLK
ncbi:MAG: pantetheine-phosphate adenylyltransferase [Candidatus Margulisbacteria bacterium]|nr:pantetheine-phosphate adenylyltransferase [Candidatus Margulisiibacteriota bacterium]